MTIDLNRLKTMSKEELINIAQQVNAPHHHANKPETLIENIINKVMQMDAAKTPEKPEDKPAPKEPVFLTEEELEKAFAPIKEKYKAFSTIYNHEARCCTMRYSDGRHRHSETMNMSCALSKFMRKAQEIAKGPLVLRGRLGDWETISSPDSKNSYTNVVL